ncbi:hypothetical protein GGX14DRAFT_620391 [Mycena pura]|uniref:Uncharacterized protein n=1 Tax=Mycena pura TaxID=153505 RepID=A0AAD6VLN8_9AGAR|nr:hypothetical protein GGX14DRAFT_620391 [Mycena pura]
MIPIGNKVKGPQLAEWHLQLMRGLISRGYRVTASGGDGASVERDCEKRVAAASKKIEHRISHPDRQSGIPDIPVTLYDLDGNIWAEFQDANSDVPAWARPESRGFGLLLAAWAFQNPKPGRGWGARLGPAWLRPGLRLSLFSFYFIESVCCEQPEGKYSTTYTPDGRPSGRCHKPLEPRTLGVARRAINTGFKFAPVKAGAFRLGLGLAEYQAGPKAVSGPQHGSAWPGCESPKAGAWRPEAEAGTSLDAKHGRKTFRNNASCG